MIVRFLKKNKEKGIIVVLVLVFGSVFLILLGGLLGFILLQLKQSNQRLAWNEALDIAEAGINYYKWCLNNQVEESCQTEKDYFDPEGKLIGHFSIEATPTLYCGERTSTTITATGWTNDFPQTKRKIKAIYARPSVAKYAFVSDEGVWYGNSEETRGEVHSNGGIRMDGENESLVMSAMDEWVCDDSFGCSSCPTESGCRIEDSNCICPGVFTTTSNSNPDLFNYPVPPFDFEGITIDLASIKTAAQSHGIYLPSSIDINPNAKGYHLVFKDNGTVDVKIITNLHPIWRYDSDEGWNKEYLIILNEYLYNNYSLSSSCPVIFVEDNVWLEGKIKGKISLASANLIDPNKDTDIIFNNNIEYASDDNTNGFFAVAEGNLKISTSVFSYFEIKGIYVAQKGRFVFGYYQPIPPYGFDTIKDKIEIYGTIVSKKRAITTWVSGTGHVIHGFKISEHYFDENLVYFPPPFVPNISPEFKIINWEEVE